VAVARASWCEAERSPSRFHRSVSATRAAANDFTVAAIFSVADALSTTRAASDAETSAGSKRAEYSLIALRNADNLIPGS